MPLEMFSVECLQIELMEGNVPQTDMFLTCPPCRVFTCALSLKERWWGSVWACSLVNACSYTQYKLRFLVRRRFLLKSAFSRYASSYRSSHLAFVLSAIYLFPVMVGFYLNHVPDSSARFTFLLQPFQLLALSPSLAFSVGQRLLVASVHINELCIYNRMYLCKCFIQIRSILGLDGLERVLKRDIFHALVKFSFKFKVNINWWKRWQLKSPNITIQKYIHLGWGGQKI